MPTIEYDSENEWTTAVFTDVDESRQHNADCKKQSHKTRCIMIPIMWSSKACTAKQFII